MRVKIPEDEQLVEQRETPEEEDAKKRCAAATKLQSSWRGRTTPCSPPQKSVVEGGMKSMYQPVQDIFSILMIWVSQPVPLLNQLPTGPVGPWAHGPRLVGVWGCISGS